MTGTPLATRTLGWSTVPASALSASPAPIVSRSAQGAFLAERATSTLRLRARDIIRNITDHQNRQPGSGGLLCCVAARIFVCRVLAVWAASANPNAEAGRSALITVWVSMPLIAGPVRYPGRDRSERGCGDRLVGVFDEAEKSSGVAARVGGDRFACRGGADA